MTSIDATESTGKGGQMRIKHQTWRRLPDWVKYVASQIRATATETILLFCWYGTLIIWRQLLISFAWNRLSLTLAMFPGDILLIWAAVLAGIVLRQLRFQFYREIPHTWLNQHHKCVSKIVAVAMFLGAASIMWLSVDTFNGDAHWIHERPLGIPYQIWHTLFGAYLGARLAWYGLTTLSVVCVTWRKETRPSIKPAWLLPILVLVIAYGLLNQSNLGLNNNHAWLAVSNGNDRIYTIIPR